MDKKLLGLVSYVTLAACAHDRDFYNEDFRDRIPVTSNVIKVDYKFDDNGQNNEIILYDKNTGNNYRLVRSMDNKKLILERLVSRSYSRESIPNIENIAGQRGLFSR